MAPSRTNASKAGPASSSAAAGGHHHTPSSAYMRTRTRSTLSGLTGPKSQSNQEQPTTPSSSLINAAGSTSTQRGPRTVKKREIHNAVERDRRNKLNERFLDLAAKLPATASVRRPSKNLVIIKSLQFVTDALNHETTYRAMIEQLLRENAAMRSEINEARLAHGTPALLLPASGLVMPATLVEIGRASHNGSSRGPRMRSGSSALLGRTDDDDEDEEDDGEEDEEDDGHEMAEGQGQGQGEAEGRSAQAGTEVHGQASSSDPLSGFFSRRTSDEEAQDFASFLGGQPQQQPFQFGQQQQQQQQQQQGMPHMQPPEAYGATGTPALFGSPFVGAQQQQNADAHSHFSSPAFAHHHQPQPQHQAQHQPARHASFSGFDLRPSTAAGEGAHSHQTGGGGGSGIFQPFRSLGLDGQAIGGNASAAGAGAATTTTSSPSPAAHGGSSSHGGAAPSSSSPSSYPSIFGFGSASAPAATGAVHGQQSERQRQQPSSPAATSASPLSGAAGGQQQQQCDLDFAGSEWLSMATAAAAAAHSLNHATHLPPPSDQCSSASSSSPLTAYSPGSSGSGSGSGQSDMSSSASSTSSSPPRFPAEDGMGAYAQAAAAGSLFFGDFLVPPPVGAGSFAFLPQQQHQQQQQHELGGDYKVPHGIEGCGAGFDAVAFLNTLVPPPPAPAPMALSI